MRGHIYTLLLVATKLSTAAFDILHQGLGVDQIGQFGSKRVGMEWNKSIMMSIQKGLREDGDGDWDGLKKSETKSNKNGRG